ncbi:MAG: hypothetical protein J6Y62_06085 [Clostridia bacterium]|nr:hypothetical protein [Clostridia bacterium]
MKNQRKRDFEGLAASFKADNRLTAAASAQCPAGILKELVRDKSFEVRLAVASNPACPQEAMGTLMDWEEFERAETEGRGFDENEYSAAKRDFKKILKALIANPSVTEEILLKIYDDKENCPSEILRSPKLSTESLRKIVSDMWYNPENAYSARKALLERLVPESKDYGSLEIMLGFQSLAPNSKEDDKKHLRVVRNPRCPAGVLKLYMKHSRPDIREAVAANPNATPEMLIEMLAEEEQYQRVVNAVLANPDLPADKIIEVAKCCDQDKAGYILNNPACPAEALKYICRRFPSLQWKVASHRNTDAETLKDIALHARDQYARGCAVENPNCPIREIEDDIEEEIYSYAVQNPNASPEFLVAALNELAPEHKWLAVNNPGFPMDRLLKLAKSRRWAERDDAAISGQCPPSVLAKLAKDSNFQVRWHAMCNAACPVSAFQKGVSDPEPEVRRHLAGCGGLTCGMMEALSKDRDVETRVRLAKNPEITEEALETLLKDGEGRVVKYALDTLYKRMKKAMDPRAFYFGFDQED